MTIYFNLHPLYTFSATKGEHLYIDGLYGDNSVNGRLISPSGLLLSNVALKSNNGFLSVLETGTYSFLVQGINNPTTLDYGFRVLDNPVSLPLDLLNTGSLGAGQSSVYKLTGDSGKILYLNSLQTSAATWKVVDGSNLGVVSGSLGSDLEFLFNNNSDYWLILENNTLASTDFKFTAHINSVISESIGFNSVTVGRINVAGQQNIHTFSGIAGQRIYYDGLSSDSTGFRITLSSPDGTKIFNGSSITANNGSLVLSETGTYTLTVDSITDAVGNYSFRLLDNSKILYISNSILNPIISETLAPSQSVVYGFNGVKGQRLTFDSLKSASGTWRLIDPSNQQVGSTGLSSDLSFTLRANGNYLLILEPSGTAPVDVSFRVQSIKDLPIVNSGFNTLYTGVLDSSQQQVYTFEANAGASIYFDTQDITPDASSFQLKDSTGAVVANFSSGSDSAIINLVRSGTYTLTIKNSGASANDYAFQLLDLTHGESFLVGDKVISSLTAKNASKLYTFSGSAGQRIYFNGLLNNSNLTVKLITPSGYAMINGASLSTDNRMLSLLETGTYSLLISANNAVSLDYGFQLLDYKAPVTLNSSYQLPRDRNSLFMTPEGIGQIVGRPAVSTGFEDGYEAIQTSLNQLPFRPGAAANIILITDEDRDVWDASLNFNNTLTALQQRGVRLNGVLNGSFTNSSNRPSLGMDPNGQVYFANGSGGFNTGTGGRYTTGSGTTKQDYIDLVWANGGTSWDINQFRGTASTQVLNATSFTKAFVNANALAIAQQLSVNLTASNTNGGFSNLTGVVSGIAGGQTANFTAQFTGTGQAQVYDLLLQRPDTGVVLGSIPVVINGAYVYDAHAVDPDGDVLAYKLLTAPTGAKIDAQTGHIRWVPTQVGDYEFVVESSDGRGGIAKQTYQLSVKELPNQLPVITSTPPTVATANQSLRYQVVATDPDANQLTYVVNAAPAGLTLDRTSGLLSWKPTAEQIGQHSIAVRVLDGRGGVTIQQISLLVEADSLNLSPHFTSTPVGQVDIEGSYRYHVTATDPNGDALSYRGMLLPDGMSFDVATQTLVWQPRANQVGEHQVVLRVDDGRGGFELQTFSLTVGLLNAAPEIVSAPLTTAAASSFYQYAVKALDSDGQVVAYQLDKAPVGMTIDSKGVINWQPTAADLGTKEVWVTVLDDDGKRSTQKYNLEVVAARENNVPVLLSIPRTTTPIGQVYLYEVVATDPDNNPLTYGLVNGPVGMTIRNGVISWQPTAAQAGSHDVAVTVSDGNATITQTYRLEVTNQVVNHNPTITSLPTVVTSLGRTYAYNLAATDLDGDSLIWSVDNAPAGVVIDARTGALRWTPTVTGSYRIAVRVTDALGAYAGQEFALTVNGANMPPQIRSTPGTKAGVNSQYRYQVGAVDLEGDALTYSLGLRPEGMAIDRNGLITWKPTAAQVGTQTIEILVTDAQGAISKQTYELVVGTGVLNQAPTISSQPKGIASLGTAYQYQVIAQDPENSLLTYALVNGPTGMAIDSATGLITWDSPVVGNAQVVVSVTDAEGLGVAQGFTLVTKANTVPTISSTSPTRVLVGGTYRYDVVARDLDGDALTYKLDQASLQLGMRIDNLGRIAWQPGLTQMGTRAVTVTVTDAVGAAVNQTFNLEVTGDNLAPVVNLVRSTNVTNVNTTVSFQVQATDNVGIRSRQLFVNNVAIDLTSNNVGTYRVTTPGVVTARAVVTDVNGNVTTKTTTVNVLDPTDLDAPAISLQLPTGNIGNLIDIVGTVTDTNLDYYVLQVAPVGTSKFTEVFRGTANVTNGVLGKFDPTNLQNDIYTLRLVAVDVNGKSSTLDQEINVSGELKLGNFRLSFTDISIPVTGIPINLTRTYDTLTSNNRDDFGYGWRMEFRDTDLRTSLKRDLTFEELGYRTIGFQDGDRVYITLPGGKREGFTFRAVPLTSDFNSVLGGRFYSPSFVADRGNTSTLTVPGAEYKNNTATNQFSTGSSGNPNNVLIRNGNGQLVNLGGRVFRPEDEGFGNRYLLTSKDGTVYEINATNGDLETVTDTNGNKLTYSDTEISSSNGQKVVFPRDAQGRIVSVTDPLGEKVTYSYDAKGDLVSVTDRQGNITRYEYNAGRAHYLDKIIDPLGREAVKTEYDEKGRLKKTTNAGGAGVEFTYDPANSIQIVRDALGNSTTYEYDARGNILTEVDAVGKITKSTYDDDNNMLSETVISDRSGSAGFKTTYTYDRNRNRLSETDAQGNTTYYNYGEKGRLLTATDPLGRTSTNSYDSRGNLIGTKDVIGNTTSFGYDSRGQVTQTTDVQGNTTLFSYDNSGNIARIVDSLGYATNYTYNGRGDRLTETKVLTTATGLQTSITRWVYDSEGRMTSTTNALGQTTQYEYNKLGKQIAVIDALGRKTQYVYNDKAELIETIYADDTPATLADNARTRTEYDLDGREIVSIDKAGRITRTVYDAVGQVVEVIAPDTTPIDLTDNPRTRTEYYSDGLVKASIDERGNRTEYRYDSLGRQIEAIYADTTPNDLTDNPTTRYQYNQGGQQISATDALNHTTRYLYDNLGRMVKMIYADNTFTTMVIAQLIWDKDCKGLSAARMDSKADKPCRFPVLTMERT
jgi:YD repeat-containing protein